MRLAPAAEGPSVREADPEAHASAARDPDARSGRRERSRRKRERRDRRARGAEREEAAEEEALAEAERRAAAKARFARTAIQYTVVVLALAIFVPIAAWVVAIVWGIGLAKDFGRNFLEPDLRRHWLAREVASARGRGAGPDEAPAAPAEAPAEDEAAPPPRRAARDAGAERRLEALSAQVAHEIRGPVTAARSLVQQMGEDPSASENVEHAALALSELDRVERSIAHLLKFARDEALEREPLRTAEVIRAAVRTLRERLEGAGVELGVRLDTEGPLRGDAEKLRRALVALLENAVDALEGAGVARPRIDLEAGENLAGSEVWVRVRDNGPGIPEACRERVFSPFYTSKESGTGLGLALAKKAVEAHGGSVEIEPASGGGTAFLLTLPKGEGGGSGAEGAR